MGRGGSAASAASAEGSGSEATAPAVKSILGGPRVTEALAIHMMGVFGHWAEVSGRRPALSSIGSQCVNAVMDMCSDFAVDALSAVGSGKPSVVGPGAGNETTPENGISRFNP